MLPHSVFHKVRTQFNADFWVPLPAHEHFWATVLLLLQCRFLAKDMFIAFAIDKKPFKMRLLPLANIERNTNVFRLFHFYNYLKCDNFCLYEWKFT